MLRKELFWDVEFDKIDFAKHQKFVIARTLRFGLPEDIKWLTAHYPEQAIIDTVKTSRTLDRKTANYWAIHYKIPREEIVCFKRQYQTECFY